MHKNLKIELMQWQVHRLKESLVDNKKNIPWLRRRNLENQTMYSPPLPLLLFVLTPLLNTFCCTFPPSFIKSPCLLYERSVILGFIFNNYSSFVNPSLHPILCGAVFIYVKLKKIKVSCHAVADKLLAEQLRREL